MFRKGCNLSLKMLQEKYCNYDVIVIFFMTICCKLIYRNQKYLISWFRPEISFSILRMWTTVNVFWILAIVTQIQSLEIQVPAMRNSDCTRKFRLWCGWLLFSMHPRIVQRGLFNATSSNWGRHARIHPLRIVLDVLRRTYKIL